MRLTPVRAPIITEIINLRPGGYVGPWAVEIGQSRLGLQDGYEGAKNVTRTFRVFTEHMFDNPIVTITTLPTRNGGVENGSQFPTTGGWGDGSYLLYYFTILDHLDGTNVWILQATYAPGYITGLAQSLWNFDIETSLETQHVMTDRDGKGIGPPRFVSVANTPQTAQFYASNIDPKVATAQLVLANGTNPFEATLPRYIVGADVPRRSSTIVLTKVINGFQLNAVWAAMNLKGLINSDDVYAYTTAEPSFQTFAYAPPEGDPWGGTVMIAGVSVRSVVNMDGGTTPQYQVTFSLKYDPDGWQHERVIMHSFDNDFEAPVRWVGAGSVPGNIVNGVQLYVNHEDNEVVKERYHINDPIPISQIIGNFQ